MRTRLVVFAAAVLTVSGCATIRGHEASSTERLLTAAGFQIQRADTPARMHDLAVVPPLKITAQSADGAVRYTYADPYGCRCLYVGGPKEYSAYQRLANEQQLDKDRIRDADGIPNGLWGPLDAVPSRGDAPQSEQE